MCGVMSCNMVRLVGILQYMSHPFGLVPGIALQTVSCIIVLAGWLNVALLVMSDR